MGGITNFVNWLAGSPLSPRDYATANVPENPRCAEVNQLLVRLLPRYTFQVVALNIRSCLQTIDMLTILVAFILSSIEVEGENAAFYLRSLQLEFLYSGITRSQQFKEGEYGNFRSPHNIDEFIFLAERLSSEEFNREAASFGLDQQHASLIHNHTAANLSPNQSIKTLSMARILLEYMRAAIRQFKVCDSIHITYCRSSSHLYRLEDFSSIFLNFDL
jgi:hypothetical protein